MVIVLDGSGVEGQPPKAGAALVRVTGVGQETESMVDKMVYGAVSHREVLAVAHVVGKIGEHGECGGWWTRTLRPSGD